MGLGACSSSTCIPLSPQRVVAVVSHRSLKALADLFALERIYHDTRMHDWDFIAPDKVGWGAMTTWGRRGESWA